MSKMDEGNFSREDDNNDSINSSQVSNLNFLFQVHPKVSYTVIAKNGQQPNPVFIAECKLDDNNAFYGEGRSKQKAKSDAATAALKYLEQTNQLPKNAKKRSSSKESFKHLEKKTKHEPPGHLQNVISMVHILFPKLQYIFPSETGPIKVCQAEVNGRLYVKEAVTKKRARMLLCAEIIKSLYGPEHIENINDVLYVNKSLLKVGQNKGSNDNDALDIPRICKDLHPTLFLNNIFQSLEYKEQPSMGTLPRGGHTVSVEVEGMVFSGSARSKKTAKLNCAINAINGLQQGGAMLEQRMEMARLHRMKNKKAKYDLYSKNKSLSSDPRLRSMMHHGNFRFTNFKRSGVLHDPNQGILYASNFDDDGERHNSHHQQHPPHTSPRHHHHHQQQPPHSSLHQAFVPPSNQPQPLFQTNLYQQPQQQPQLQQQLPSDAYYNQGGNNNNRYLNNESSTHHSNNFQPYSNFNQIKPEW